MATKTGVQLNQGYTATDDFITRTWILPLLTDKAKRAKLIEEHRNNPVGKPGKAGKPAVQHSDDLARVIDKFRRAPQAGKYVRICVVPHKEYAIGVLSGVRGKPVKVLENKTYKSEDDCEHAIFVRRVDDFLAAYRVKK
jgi:hypothetical protein